jgi:hypothetical protein
MKSASQQVIIFEGPDGVGKTEIARELARRLEIPYFKPRVERANWKMGGDSFLNELRYGEIRELELVRQTGLSMVKDRGYPSEHVYSKVFGRQTDVDLLSSFDAAYAQLGVTVIICLMSDYGQARPDDLVDAGKIWRLHDAYLEFKNLSLCKTYSIYTDLLGKDIERQMRYIEEVTGWPVGRKKEG